MVTFLQLPPDILYEIALHFPFTRDILAISLTNSYIRVKLLTPSLFKARLELQGWDVSAWNDEHDDDAQFSGNLERWMRIDNTYCRTARLFEEAAKDTYFLSRRMSDGSRGVVWGWCSGWCNPYPGGTDSPQVVDGTKIIIWLRKLREVLPSFVTHHRGGNISRITEARHRDVLWAYTRVVTELCKIVSDSARSRGRSDLGPSRNDWFESVFFSLIALLMQCDASTIISIFADRWTDITSRLICFNTILSIQLHLDAARTGMPQHSLPVPSPPHLHLRSSYFTYPDYASPVVKLAATTTSSYLWPWLRNGLAGTPFAGLSSMMGRPWVGYYTLTSKIHTDRGPSMFLELRSEAGPPPHTEPDTVHFRGEGHDSIGAFSVSGTCDTRTGAVTAIKAYRTHEWEWRGMMTPFGMAGMWGRKERTGLWWIWPQEWSPAVDSDSAREWEETTESRGR